MTATDWLFALLGAAIFVSACTVLALAFAPAVGDWWDRTRALRKLHRQVREYAAQQAQTTARGR